MAIVEEKQFIERLRKGDRHAFNQLIELHKDAVLNICYGYIKDPDDAEDLAQEVFLEVYRTISNFREESSLFTWIYRIAISRSLDELKKRKSLKRAAFFEKRIRSAASDLELEQTPGSLSVPDTALEQKQQRQFIDYCLSQLVESQQAAFILSQQDGFSYVEIADILNKSVSSVESLVHRSKQNLRKIMKQNYSQYFE